MKTVHQFGDSYGAILYNENDSYIIKNFIELAANQIDFRYVNRAVGGSSNEMVLNTLLKCINEINSGDVIFVNFSFFTRGCWYDSRSRKIKSTNELYSEMRDNKHYDKAKNEHVVELVEYYLRHTEDYNKRIFTLIDSTLKSLNQRGISIFYIFADDIQWADSLLSTGVNVRFPNGFSKWLQKNKLHSEEEGHYTKGIQPSLASAILSKTKNFKENSENVYIDIEDINLKVVLPKPIKQKLF